MRDGKALTDLPEFGGKAYKAGATIPGKVLAEISPQVLKSLINNYKIEVDGMEPSGGGMGAGSVQHLTARLDALVDQNKKLLDGFKSLEARVIALETGKSAPTSRRAARAATAKE